MSRADQITTGGQNFLGATVLGLREGRLSVRLADGRTTDMPLGEIELLIVDRAGGFDDFNEAERLVAGGELQKAVTRYDRALRVAEGFWADVIASRLVLVHDRLGQLDDACHYLARLAQSQWSGPAAVAGLIPRSFPAPKTARFGRSIRELEAALATNPPADQRAVLALIRFGLLHKAGDRRSQSAAQEAIAVTIPAQARTPQLYAMLTAALQVALESEPTAPEFEALDRAIESAPDETLPDLLVLKGRTLLSKAVTRDEIMRACWPPLRVAIHMPKDPRAAEALAIAERGLERLGNKERTQQDQGSARSGAAPASPQRVPAEERRLSTALFREGLKQRGLHDLLELHLKDFPLQSPIDERLMQRDVEMARFRDAARPSPERLAAVSAANAILEELIREHPADARRLEWMYTLGYSLVFEQAEPHATNLLYFGDSPEDVEPLHRATDAGVQVLRSLGEAITNEYARIDKLPADQLQVLEKSGFLDQLDRIAPNAEYVLLWAIFYRAIARPEGDAQRTDGLHEILASLSASPAILQTPQEQSRVQVAAHLLAGMAHRRLGHSALGREFFEKTKSIAERLVEAQDRVAVAGPVNLAEIEAVRNELAEKDWHATSAALDRLRRRLQAGPADRGVTHGDAFVLKVAAALLDRDLHLAWGQAAEETERLDEAAKHRRQAWQGVTALALQEPQQLDRLYAVLFRAIPADADPERLAPIQQASIVAGLMAKAETEPSQAGELTARAISIGEQLLARLDENSKPLAPDVLRRLAIAHYRAGDSVAAARRFLQIAAEYPRDPRAEKSAELAVQLAVSLQTSGVVDPASAELYAQAMRTLFTQFGSSPAAQEWRFFYAELLYERGELDAAVAEYHRVPFAHEHGEEAAVRGIYAQAEAIRRLAALPQAEPSISMSQRGDRLLSAWREFVQRREGAARDSTGTDRLRMLGEATLAVAEALVMPAVGRADVAVELLVGFEQRFGDAEAIRPRLWRARMIAYGASGRIEDTAAAISAYLDVDPTGAGATLQKLYDEAVLELRQSTVVGQTPQSQQKAQIALTLAKALVKWAEKSDLSDVQIKTIQVQLGEAHLAAGEAEQARGLFEPLASVDSAELPREPHQLRTLLGYAISLEALDDCQKALPLFNRLATGLSPQSPVRWEALLGDLRCRTKLNDTAEGILRVVQQQKHLYPELGGVRFAAQFEEIVRQNEKRRSSAVAPERR